MKISFRLGLFFAGAALLAGCGACDLGNSPDDDSGHGQDTVLALARIKAVSLDGVGDTVVTSYSYDANGARVRERFEDPYLIIWEYDSLGRYMRWRQPVTDDTNEVNTWVTADSSYRGAAGSGIITHERWFGLKPNCRCGDSLYRYGANGNLLHKRRWTYDAQGNMRLVTRDYLNPARRDTAQRYDNVYAGGRLAYRIANDAEIGDTTRQVHEYAPLGTLLEAR